ncbi:MAG TPA: glycosyl hydrolase [Longimicrobiales bacterium]|nr:glycosyl hydrolase [Longimicrobiales bacterium]
MIEAIMLWNEPNNVSHWDRECDPEWTTFAEMCRLAVREIRSVAPGTQLVLGGISPIDPSFLRLLSRHGLLAELDVIAVHGFPYDWNLWHAEEWPWKIEALEREFGKPVWVTETGVSSWASETNMAWATARLARILRGCSERIHWYSLFDLASNRVATTRHGPAEGSSYWRHFHFGLLREDGTPKPALHAFDSSFGICQWFQFQDQDVLDRAVEWLQRLGVSHLRTGLSWAEWHMTGSDDWFDRIVEATAPFHTTLTLCFTPPSEGVRPHHTSPPRDVGAFARFAKWVAERYLAGAGAEGRQLPHPSGAARSQTHSS